MKFIIRQILIALVLITIIHESKCKYEFKKSRLSRLFENIIEDSKKEYEDEIENEISRAYDMDCVKNFFNLPQNDKMMVNEVEEMFFRIASGIKCSDEDKIFKNLFGDYARISSLIKPSCIKWNLHQLEPTSKLVENFNISEVDREECEKDLPDDELLQIQQTFESYFGPINVYTCGAVSENPVKDFKKFFTKEIIINFDDISDELKRSEKEKLKLYLKDISIRTVNCITKRFEDNPQGRFIIFKVMFILLTQYLIHSIPNQRHPELLLQKGINTN